MSDAIRFYVPKGETVPTDLRLYVGDVYVKYHRIDGGFLFEIMLDDDDDALKVAEEIVAQIQRDHAEPQHGVSWRTELLRIIPQEERYKIGTWVEWIYRVRDSY